MVNIIITGLNAEFKKHLEVMLGGDAGNVGSAKTLPSVRPKSVADVTSPTSGSRKNMPLPPTPNSHLIQDHDYEELPANYIRPIETTYVNEQF